MNTAAMDGKYRAASDAMLCPCIAKLDRLDEFQPPAVVDDVLDTSD